MFDQSASWQRLSSLKRRPRVGSAWRPITLAGREIQVGEHRERVLRVNLGLVPDVLPTEERERRGRWLAFAAAVGFHALLLVVSLPELRARELSYSGQPRAAYVVEPVRFQAPPPSSAPRQAARKKKVKRVPIPDPTPDAPEPIERELDIEFDLDLDLPIDDVLVDLPPAPSPGLGAGRGGRGGGSGLGAGAGALRLSEDIQPPKRIHATQVLYTEEARKAGTQGVVLLEAVITETGDVEDVAVILPQPHGLTENAIAALKQWKYEPARKDGRPVAVIMAVTITFQIQ